MIGPRSGLPFQPIDGMVHFFRNAQMPDPRDFRLRHFLWIVLAAVLIAGLLRHILHVYGGWSREDIRLNALLAAAVIGVATIFFRRLYRR